MAWSQPPRMTNSEKLQAVQEHFKALGIYRYTGAPPILRLLWRIGIPAPPLVFWHPVSIALFLGGYFAIFWGLFMWVMEWSGPDTSPWVKFGVPALAGGAFGVYNAVRSRRVARKYNFPPWADYKGVPAAATLEAQRQGSGTTDGNVATRRPRFAKDLPCPYCQQTIPVSLLRMIPSWLGHRILCPHCHECSTMKYSTRILARACGFGAIVIVVSMLLVPMLIDGITSNFLLWTIIGVAGLAGLATQVFMSVRFGTLVKSRFF